MFIWFLQNAPADLRPRAGRVSPDQTAREAASRKDLLARIDGKFDCLLAQQDDRGYLLFAGIPALSGSRRMIGRVLKEAYTLPRWGSRTTDPPMASAERRSPGERAALVESRFSAEATDIAVTGPHWIEEMFQLEGIDTVDRRHRAGTVIFCLTKEKGPEVARVAPESARSRGARTIARLLDDIADGASSAVISQFDHVYAARARVGDELRTMSRRPVRNSAAGGSTEDAQSDRKVQPPGIVGRNHRDPRRERSCRLGHIVRPCVRNRA
ncbi:MAG: hypothetical protein M5U09_11560 [Gammaproteobacteria bacterium]|nr:hypothetical protein [Gammaproteobacteria bacterium]